MVWALRGSTEAWKGIGSTVTVRVEVAAFCCVCLRRCSMNFAHVPVVYARHLPIVPGDRDRIPTRFGDNAAISGITSPIHSGALLETLGFGGCHCRPSRCLAVAQAKRLVKNENRARSRERMLFGALLLQTASDFVQFLRRALSFARATSTHERALSSRRVSLIHFSSVSPFVGIDVCSL
jgi:hypothetical protein